MKLLIKRFFRLMQRPKKLRAGHFELGKKALLIMEVDKPTGGVTDVPRQLYGGRDWGFKSCM